MNPFHTVAIRAAEGRLPSDFDIAYYRSTAFRLRTEFNKPGALDDQLRIAHYLLTRIALDPRELPVVQSWLKGGCVTLRYFGISNPTPVFLLTPGSPEHKSLKEAVDANISGPLFAAAKRVMKWREPKRTAARGRQEEAVVTRLNASLSWPASQAYREGSPKAREEHNRLCAVLQSKREEVRQRRNDRLALLAKAAAPDLGSWYELLEDIALNALPPPAEMH